MPNPAPQNTCDALTVLYDGACPLCRREVGVYQGLTPLQPVQFRDVSDAQSALPAGGDRAHYLARFHVQRADGEVLSGAAAFVALWAALPGWRWLARIGALPGMTALMEVAYRGFLRVRPAMQRIARAMEPAAAATATGAPVSASMTASMSAAPAAADHAPAAAPTNQPIHTATSAAIKLPADMVGELRSDHAGETGAVWIYHGVLAFARDAAVRDFARRHRDTERQHLQLACTVLPAAQRSKLLLPWRAAGFITGALPALCGPRAVYATIAAVETFVDKHYQQQIDRLAHQPENAALRDLLIACQADECHHRDEALALQRSPHNEPSGWLLRTWCAVVGNGSETAVHIARRF
jgi:3-demethoxyubiquinol 3-hydroxylase